ncbi:MAG: phage tail tape measure protein, partial [Lachnospiraceae bacterium]|nr:phage tail tape measure protein [Lachnospiraceae bacterium]
MSTPKIGAVLALDGEKEYKSAISSINAAQRELRSEMKLATEQFSSQQNTIEALTKKQEILSEQHTLQASKVELCEAAVKKYNTTQQELSSKVDAAKEKLDKEKETLEKLKSTTGATTEEIEAQEKAVNEAQAALKDINADYENACKKQSQWNTSLNTAKLALEETDKALEENEGYLKEAQEATNGCATSIDEFGVTTEETKRKAAEFGSSSLIALSSLSTILDNTGISDKIRDIASSFLECVSVAATFETSMAKISTLVDTSTISMSDMSAEVLAVSSELGVSATEIAEATYQAISAGQSAENAVSMVETATKLSIGGFTDSATAVDILTTALNAYGLEAEDAENISNILITTQNLGKTTVSELASTMGRVIPLASAYNVEMDNLASAYAIMTANGIATAETTTYLKSMLNELGDSSSDVATILQNETGMSFSELSEAGYSLGDVMDILGTSVNNDATAFSNLWSSSEAGIGALSLLNSGSAKYNSTLKSMQNSAGATESAYESMADTTEMAQQHMEVAAENLKIAVGEELTPAMEKLYDTGGDVLEFLEDFAEENPTVVKLLASLTAGMVAFTAATTAATVAAEAFKVIQTLVNPTTLLVTALVGLTSAAVVFNATLETEQTELQKTNTASKDMAKSLKELNDSYATSSASRKASTDSLSAQSTVCKDLVAQLEALQEKTALTADEQSQQQAIVDQLNTLMPELGLSIEENTGKTNLSTEAIEANAEALLKQAEAEAYTEIAADITKELTEAKIELAEAETQLEEQQEQTRAATEAYNEAISNAAGDERDYMFAVEEAKNAMEESEKAEKTLQEAYDEASDTVAALEEEYSTYQDCLADVYAQEAATEATTELGDAAEETSDKISSMSETAQEAYSEMYESLSDTISSQMDLFDEFNGEAELKTSELLSNMQSQVDGITEWSENLEELAERGIDEGLLQHLADMGPEGASYVSTFAQMTNDELEEANKL